MKKTDFSINILSVQKCALCKKPTGKGILCNECFKLLSFSDNVFCKPYSRNLSKRADKYGAMPYTACIAPFKYHSKAVTALVYKLKKNGNRSTTRFFAENMVTALRKSVFYPDFAFITYVPMRKSAVIKKGFDHAKLLADQISDITGVPVCRPPFYRKRGGKQKYRNLSERKAAGNRFVLKGKISGNVLLVDDVTTTGVTFYECAKLLKKAGAYEVVCVAAAQTDIKNKK